MSQRTIESKIVLFVFFPFIASYFHDLFISRKVRKKKKKDIQSRGHLLVEIDR